MPIPTKTESTTTTTTTTSRNEVSHTQLSLTTTTAATNIATAATTTATTTTTTTVRQQQQHGTSHMKTVEKMRSMEASAIRRLLSLHDYPVVEESTKESIKKANTSASSTEHPQRYATTTPSSVGSSAAKPWEVEHFPLLLSRYQREFKEIALLNAGSFGQVYHTIRELDGCEYAIKKITFDSFGYSNETIQHVIREVQCLATVSDHPNIVRYYTSWLEPSWMTGGGNSSADRQQKLRQLQMDANNHASPQKLLKDIEDFVDYYSSEDEKSSWSSSSSSSSSSSYNNGKSWFGTQSNASTISENRRRRRRSSSWDSSVRSVEGTSWNSYHSHTLERWAHAYDDSYISQSSQGNRRRSSRNAQKTKPKPKMYKYQISLFIQMQLCHPATLQDWILERNRQIPESDHAQRIGPALEIFHQLCSGLAHVHEKNIIHRDLKPANIFASSDGKVVKIGDFGLSKQLHDFVNQSKANENQPSSGKSCPPRRPVPPKKANKQGNNLSSSPHQEYWLNSKAADERAVVVRAGTSSAKAIVAYNSFMVNEPLTAGIGTASYAAPEQVKSKNYGTSVDIFSLGLIFLELVCCFDTEHERLHNFQQCRNQRLPTWLEQHYPDISTIILACTSPNPRERPTAKELVERTNSKSPKSQIEVHVLRGQLLQKDKELAEKDKMIENMRLEMERMKATLLLTNGSSLQDDQYLVEDATTFHDDY
jgi:serine/threonine protein kinase